MVVLWVMLQWWPMVPRIDWQQIKNALKPLLLTPRWSVFSALEAALGLRLIGLMVQRPASPRLWLVLALVGAGRARQSW